ncbi:Sensor histidine kinase YehU [Paenibacillus konkukensis]|uniref:Sensor histidine kinase YehU n=1 Tax=Paenibacillus konkukensis TaxID=2020716 RepID=A0ABY4RHQ8_9BACL|nr:sensor histidine kinase [Paenibacillus konkukensis]UQZ81310.1 Sensor histidine kinase YehU [Paenibacillus konkukensis]
MLQRFKTMVRKFRALSLRGKLFVLLILLSLVPTLTVSFISQYLIVRSSTNYTAAISSQLIEYMANEINNYFIGMNETLNTVVINSEFQKFLSVPKDSVPDQSGYSISFRPLLQLLIQSKKEILSVLYLDSLGKVYSESQKVHIQYEYPFQKDPVFSQVFGMTKEGLLAPHPMNYAVTPSAGQQVVTFVKPVIDLQQKSVGSWLLIEIDAAWLQKMMDHTKLGQDGRMVMYNRETGELVNFGEAGTLPEGLSGQLKDHSRSPEPFLATLEGNRYQVMSHPIPLGGWTLVGISQLDEVSKGIKQAQTLTYIVAAISLMLALLIAFPVMGAVLKPLYRLKSGMQMLGRGTSVPIEHSAQDEIGFLINTYNRMLDDLEILRKEVLRSKLSEKEKELLQLQAQINPHFLFNTLETIESYSLHNDGEAVSDMLQCVSRMMRYNVRKDRGLARLEEELEYTSDFLHIHSYRYGRRVQADFAIAPELLDAPVMKLSIQPFVENSLKYGWSPLADDDDFRLRISVQPDGDHWVFTVADNGSGMPEDVLQRMENLAAAGGEPSDPYFARHTGILSVYRRYELAYGERFSMRIGRNRPEGRGTLVRVRLPRSGDNPVMP